jgi:acyl carrier protein
VSLSSSGASHVASSSEFVAWLRGYLSDLLSIPEGEIDADQSFDRLGIDSATALGLTDEVARVLGRRVEPSLFFEHRSLRLAARHLFPASAAPREE